MLRNIGSNWVLVLATIGVTYVLTPFLIETLGEEGYGTWTLIVSFTAYIGLLALGVPMACVRYLAQHVAERDARMLNAMIGSCAALYLVISVLAIVVGALSMRLFGLYEIPAAYAAQAPLAFALMVVYVSAGFVGLLPEGILFAHHAFVPRNLVRITGVVLRLGLTIVVLRFAASLVLLALVQIGCLLFDVCATWLIIRRRYPDVRLNLGDASLAMVRRILSFSMYAVLLAAGARLSFETAALVIGATLGVASIPFYVVANNLIVYLMEFVIAIAAVVSPMATSLATSGRRDELREMFLKWSKVALSLTLMAGLFLLVLGPRFIGWWIDPAYERDAGAVLQILTLSSLVFLPVRGVAVPVLMGMGRPKAPAVATFVAGLANLALSLVLVGPLGLVGVALGAAIPNVLLALLILAVACRELEVTPVRYLQYVVPRAALGALPILALLLWFRVGLQVHSVSGLAAAGTAMMLLFGVTWAFYVYRDDPYVDMRTHMIRLRAWSRA
ncbi:MAG TPA: oligosaccharide flippase family protein [Vicinamibacterales bacterium]